MAKLEKLDFDCELLKPVKENVSLILNRLLSYTSVANKTAEITLKITVDSIEKHETDEETGEQIEWVEPRLEFQISEKIKETKSTAKYNTGYDYEMKVNDKDNCIYVKKINEQLSMY